MARKYELKKRAEQQEETRRRIAAAAVELHSTVGPSRTTITAIAERAGVERLTVYRHFPDEEALYEACTSLGWESSPGPDPAGWLALTGPEDRLRRGLTDTYAYFRANRLLLANVRRDADTMPIVRWAVARFRQPYIDTVRSTLVEAWPREGRAGLEAVVGHATDFGAWESLDQQGLEDAAKVDLMVDLVRVVARKASKAPASPASPSRRAAG